MSAGILYLVPTPIGNLEDITERARRILAEVDLIACEDSRVTGKLLKHLEINTEARLISYHDFNEQSRAAQLIDVIQSGQSVAVVTDAGSPGISDPAYRVIRAAIDAGITITPLPGANSIIPALTGSGLPLDRFFFEGFAQRTSSTRRKRFIELQEFPHTLIFMESPQRILQSLTDAHAVLGDRQACIAREITKAHEEFIRGSLDELVQLCKKHPPKGEIVLVISGKPKEKRVKINKYRPEQ